MFPWNACFNSGNRVGDLDLGLPVQAGTRGPLDRLRRWQLFVRCLPLILIAQIGRPFVVAVTAAVEHQTHKSEPDKRRDHDA